MKHSKWKWIYHANSRFDDVGILPDGTLHNPNGYPEDLVRAAILRAETKRHERASKAAKQAAETRARRQEKKVYDIARQLTLGDGAPIGPTSHCVICGRSLDDPESIARGIGSECWQAVLSAIRFWSATLAPAERPMTLPTIPTFTPSEQLT
jgi:hypothetical protein